MLRLTCPGWGLVSLLLSNVTYCTRLTTVFTTQLDPQGINDKSTSSRESLLRLFGTWKVTKKTKLPSRPAHLSNRLRWSVLMSQSSLTSWRSHAVRDAREASSAPCSSRHTDCRRCSHLSASTSYSESQRFLLQSRQQSHLHRTRALPAITSNDSIVVTEHTATDSLREALRDTGPVKDLGYLSVA